MPTALFTHQDCKSHLTPDGHPEQVARLDAVLSSLSGDKFGDLRRFEAPIAPDSTVLLCHPEAYLDHIKSMSPKVGTTSLDADTFMSPGSLKAALRAVGGVRAAVDAVLVGDVSNAFVACRPPGHHAETAKSMGFCLFGNIAIAAKHALAKPDVERVAIIDFDVHHGNGTQDLMWAQEGALFCSTHQMPLYPGSGAAHETGSHGNIINVPLQAESGGHEMRAAYEKSIFPAVRLFSPDLILVSAGFDAHRQDPLANLNWETADFA